ncbi:MAG TPA: endonuclease/exonuclease/phosphatase family protein [Planctomycetota bacterium]|nr:endonuclease/exonuclease/phosphatase family protein [Planctomycetota bacterium]
MVANFLTRRRAVRGQEVSEPTLLALALTLTGLTVLFAGLAAAIYAFSVLGHGWLVFALVAAVLVWLVVWPRRRSGGAGPPATGRLACHLRLVRLARKAFTVALAGWLGLIVYAELTPGGQPAEPKADPAAIRLITWNIHRGQDSGPPWKRLGWRTRKRALQAALGQASPDLLCVQEALPEQVQFLEGVLPTHHRLGVGRDDGRSAGQHCAIYFRRDRFEEISGGTFWLEEPVDEPRPASALGIKRICTWARLRERDSGRVLRLYNAHFPPGPPGLPGIEGARQSAARVLLAQLAAGDPDDAILLVGDLNASPGSLSRRLFAQAGLADSAALAGKPVGAATFQLYGIRLRPLDAVLVAPRWRVHDHRILDVKPGNTFPSDHFGVVVDLALRD